NTWGTITNVAMGTTSHYWVTLRTNPFPQPGRPKILGAVLDLNDDLGAITWDGSAFTVVGANSFTANAGSHTFENFDLQYHPAPGSVYYKNRAGGTWRPTDANTRIIVTESDDGFLDAYVCTPTCVVTNNIGQVWSTAPASGTPQARFDIAYEQVSGKAVLAYHKEGGSGTQDLAYKTY